MTGTPSKDRAEARETPAHVTAEILDGMSVAFAGTGGFSILRGRIAAALTKARADGFAEGMKRGFELGFASTSEGYNSEYPFDGELSSDAKWCAMRDRVLSEAL